MANPRPMNNTKNRLIKIHVLVIFFDCCVYKVAIAKTRILLPQDFGQHHCQADRRILFLKIRIFLQAYLKEKIQSWYLSLAHLRYKTCERLGSCSLYLKARFAKPENWCSLSVPDKPRKLQ